MCQCGLTQRRADDTCAGQQAQVGVGAAAQFVAATRQIPGRATVGNHQRHHLAQRPALRAQDLTLPIHRRQQRIDTGKVRRKPHPQAVAQAIDFAMAGRGRERHSVEVVQHQAAAHRQRILALAVGAYAGRHHLAQLLARIKGDAVGRMAVLLDLRRQRAAARGVKVGIEHAPHLRQRSARETRPVHRRVQRRPRLIEQIAVLDEQQGLRHHRGHGGKVGVAALGVAKVVQQRATTVAHVEPGARLLRIGRGEPLIDVVQQSRAEAGLGSEGETTRLQTLDETRQLSVAQALIEGAVCRIAHGIAVACNARIVELCSMAADEARLQARAVQFMRQQHAPRHQRHQHADQDCRAQHMQRPHAARARCGRRAGGRGCAGIHRVTDRYCIASIIRNLVRKNDTVTATQQEARSAGEAAASVLSRRRRSNAKRLLQIL